MNGTDPIDVKKYELILHLIGTQITTVINLKRP